MARKKSFSININGELAQWIEGIVTERRSAMLKTAELEGWTEEEIEHNLIDHGKGKVAREFLALAKVRWEYDQLLEELNGLDTRTKEEGDAERPSNATVEAAFGITATDSGDAVSGIGSGGGGGVDSPAAAAADMDTGEQHA